MRLAVLGYLDEEQGESLPEAGRQAFMDECSIAESRLRRSAAAGGA